MHFVLTDTQDAKNKWASLVAKHQVSVFSELEYLEATAIHWGVLYADDDEAGMACPFTIKAGVKVLVTPFFVRYLEWVGPPVDVIDIKRTLQSIFPVADIQVKFQDATSSKVFQQLNPGKLKLNQQAKRSLKKAVNMRVSSQSIDEQQLMKLLNLIESELMSKVSSINERTIQLLFQLVQAYRQNGLIQLDLWEDSKWCGGLWLIESQHRVLYLKGTTTATAKQDGGMYLLMQHAIEQTHQSNKVFDFGGSNVSNVKRFNASFGAEDVVYSQWKWNNAPLWWKGIKFLNDLWKKR
jgi:hypothetical protein